HPHRVSLILITDNDPRTNRIYPLSLHDALPIFGYTHIIHRCSVQVRVFDDTGQGRVTPVAGTVNGNALGVGNLLIDQPLNAISNVVLHAQTPLLEARFPELATITC